MRKIVFIISILTLSSGALSQGTTCDRSAYVNFEKVLIDSSSSIKGDGIKYLLEKDPKAYDYLKLYQESGRPSSRTAIVSSLGLGLSLGGYLFGKSSGTPFLNKNVLLGVGLSIVIGNFLYNRSKQAKNEKNLLNAIYEYNLRNTPKIYFAPYKSNKKNDSIGIGVGVNKSF